MKRLDNEPFFPRHECALVLRGLLRERLGVRPRNAPTFRDRVGDTAAAQATAEVVRRTGIWLDGVGPGHRAPAAALASRLPPSARDLGLDSGLAAWRRLPARSLWPDREPRSWRLEPGQEHRLDPIRGALRGSPAGRWTLRDPPLAKDAQARASRAAFFADLAAVSQWPAVLDLRVRDSQRALDGPCATLRWSGRAPS